MKPALVRSLLGIVLVGLVASMSPDPSPLRAANVAETVPTATAAPLAAPAPPPVPLLPDDPRLVDLVRLIQSGISEAIIEEQVRQSPAPFTLSVADLLYLKQNGVLESTIGVLMATRAGAPSTLGIAASPAAPQELAFDDLVLVRPSVFQKNRPGRLVLRGDSLAWVDAGDAAKSFDFQITGLSKVWFTCQARAAENFCYQINFQIVKGDRYRFRDLDQDSGSNATVLKIMQALRAYFPQTAFGPPDA